MRLIRVTLPDGVKGQLGRTTDVYDAHHYEEDFDVNRAITSLVGTCNIQEEDIIGIQWVSEREFCIVAKGKPRSERQE